MLAVCQVNTTCREHACCPSGKHYLYDTHSHMKVEPFDPRLLTSLYVQDMDVGKTEDKWPVVTDLVNDGHMDTAHTGHVDSGQGVTVNI